MELERFKLDLIPLREKLQRQARDMLKDDIEAEDAVQETYLKLWNVRTQLDAHPNVGGYAMQTLKNVCVDKLRIKKPQNTFLDNVSIVGDTSTPYEYAELKDSVAIVRWIMDELPETQRRIMHLRDIDGYEFAEIAAIIGADETAVRVNLSRARKTVRNRFLSINQRIGI